MPNIFRFMARHPITTGFLVAGAVMLAVGITFLTGGFGGFIAWPAVGACLLAVGAARAYVNIGSDRAQAQHEIRQAKQDHQKAQISKDLDLIQKDMNLAIKEKSKGHNHSSTADMVKQNNVIPGAQTQKQKTQIEYESLPPIVTVEMVKQTLKTCYGNTINEMHDSIRNAFAVKYAGLLNVMKTNPHDTNLIKLRGELEKAFENFELKTKKDGKIDASSVAKLNSICGEIKKSSPSKPTAASPAKSTSDTPSQTGGQNSRTSYRR